ncbi:hypothetical protein [Pseudohongiella spirulinae]|uniref:Uncharacterized protein n=1 Tax=Pseudohongiella spirulinae TaxID=1249552 RepID=A0A0S2KAL1_9GAMM|nr:hypothetical protein [Pseudohongiella spirulinae]ALO45371.1 hypothetical protein PS2015_691 [Pseudohongiella spirulinae]
MKINLPIPEKDLALLKWPAIISLVALVLATSVYFLAQYLDQQSTAALVDAQQSLERVRTSIEQISQEEATIVQYIDRFLYAQETGFLDEEDRLGFLENMASIREQLQLFPITVELGTQFSIPLSYLPEDPLPGSPLTLRGSTISLQTGLLHEFELSRLMDGLRESRGILQPIECSLLEQSPGDRFSQVTENIRFDCSFNWYSINLNPDADELSGGF